MPFEIRVLGTVLGTAEETDIISDLMYTFYDFKSMKPELPDADTIAIDYEGGTLEVFDEEGNGIQVYQLKRLV
jgi:hypothetical protein